MNKLRKKMSIISKWFIALWIILSSAPIGAEEILGSYTFAGRGLLGTMSVTDMSACDVKRELGCISAVRPLKVKIEIEKEQSDEACNLNVIENTVARIQSPSEIDASFNLEASQNDKGSVDIVFHKRSAIISKSDASCASKVDISGAWKKVEEGTVCAPKQIIFSCIAKGGKKIEICDQGRRIRYSFGKEMVLEVDRNSASTYQWNGNGRSITYMVRVPSKGVEYEVFFSADRLTEKHEIDAGVNVIRGNKTLATVKCIEPGLENNIEGIDLRKYD